MSPDKRIEELKLALPEPIKLPPNVKLPFSWVRVRGDRAYVSGHVALNPDGSISEIKRKSWRRGINRTRISGSPSYRTCDFEQPEM